jgi:hypothetical protein
MKKRVGAMVGGECKIVKLRRFQARESSIQDWIESSPVDRSFVLNSNRIHYSILSDDQNSHL